MKKIEAIIREDKLQELKTGLIEHNIVTGMTIMQAFGTGKREGRKAYVRGQEVIPMLIPKVVVSFIVCQEKVEEIIDFIISICQTGEIGDGKIFVYPVEEVVRIRNGQRGPKAV